jgi:hypothetical protein
VNTVIPLPTRFVWHPSRGRGHRSDLLQLAPWAEKRIDVIVGPAQAVLVLRDHAVIGVLGPGTRSLAVGSLGAGWARRVGEPAVADRSFEGCESVASSDQLLYVPTDRLPLVQWSLGSQRLSGHAELRVENPSRYYESFLRHAEDLEEGPLADMLGRLIASVAERWMAQRGGGVPIDSPQLEDELSATAAASLAGVGLKLMSLQRETRDFVLRS